MAIDYYDLIWKSEELFGEAAIDRLFSEYAERGFTGVQWRVSVHGKLLYHTKLGDGVAEMRGFGDVPGFSALADPILKKAQAVLSQIDPMEVAARLCRKHGLKFYPWLTIYDDAGFHPATTTDLLIRHPEYCWKSQNEEVFYHGVTSYVYPEVVDYRLAQIRELLSYEADGVYLCTRSHARPPGWTAKYMEFLRTHSHEEWAASPSRSNLGAEEAACRGRFGFDPPAVEAYQTATGRAPQPDDADWWKFRGGYLVDYLKKAKSLAANGGQELSFGPHGEYGVYPSSFFDWQRMAEEHVVDEFHFGATDDFCGQAEAKIRYPWLFHTPGRKNYFHCVKDTKSADDHIRAFDATGNAEFLHQMDGLTIFEAYMFPLRPELWKFVDHLRKVAGV